jgi:hypothetical protein
MNCVRSIFSNVQLPDYEFIAADAPARSPASASA